MAQFFPYVSLPGITLPPATWPALQRLAGANGSECRFEIMDGPLAGRVMVFSGTGFSYDALAMPKAGSVTAIRFLEPDQSLIYEITGLSQPANALRSSATPQALLSAGDDYVGGTTGHDRMLGGGGDDEMLGFDGADRMDGGLGNDTIRGSNGNDVLKGQAGNDELTGGTGYDVVRGDAGDDVIRFADDGELVAGEFMDGGEGFDTLLLLGDGTYDLTKADLINMEALAFGGAATAVIGRAQYLDLEQVSVSGAAGTAATLALQGTGVYLLDLFDLAIAPGTALKVELRSAGSTAIGRDGSSDTPNDHVIGSAGNDTVMLFSGDDTGAGGAGNDVMNGGEGLDSLFGGTGNDTVAGGSGGDSLAGEDGNDLLMGEAGQDRLLGGAGADTMNGGEGADSMFGGSGDDLYFVDVSLWDRAIESDAVNGGYDTVVATVDYTIEDGIEELRVQGSGIAGHGNGAGNVIVGVGGTQSLHGHGGNDTLIGSTGADYLYGGSGADDFTFRTASESTASAGGRDRIQDFSRFEGDVIDLSEIDANTALAGNQAFTSFGQLGVGPAATAGSLRWTVQNGNTIVYGYTDNVAGADFSVEMVGIVGAMSSDFIF